MEGPKSPPARAFRRYAVGEVSPRNPMVEIFDGSSAVEFSVVLCWTSDGGGWVWRLEIGLRPSWVPGLGSS